MGQLDFVVKSVGVVEKSQGIRLEMKVGQKIFKKEVVWPSKKI